MKNKGSLVTCLFLIAAYGAIATATNISYGSGFTSAGLTLNGSAAINGTRLRLTNGGTSEAGSAFFNTPVNVQSFTNDFSFQLTNATADGFTFTLQGNNPNALGPKGGGLGYGADKPGGTPGIGRSVAVKFDLFSNAGEGNDSTGLYTSGASPTTPFVDLTNTGINLHSGHTFNVHMTYDGATLVVQITDATSSTSFHTSFPVNIPNLVGGSTGYVGFTGGSGGLTAVQDILSWTYVPSGSGNPQPLQITTGSLPAGAVGVSYQAVLAAANGVPSYTWSLMGGQLPTGLGFQASTGKISGMPSQAGAFTFSVQVKDSSGHTASGTLSANIAPASAPLISSVSPKSGPTSGGTLVSVSGSNFQPGATVLFGGVTASSVTVSSSTLIQAAVHAHIAGAVDVTVRNPDGETSTDISGFTYTPSLALAHSLYAINPGPVISVYDLDSSGFNFVNQIRAGTSTDQIRGVVASAVDGMLYISYGCTSPTICAAHLMKYDLATAQIIWDKLYPLGIDSHAITPDGRTIYMPTGEEDIPHSQWQIIDTSSGNLTGLIDSTVKAPHNTIVGNNGAHVYMGSVHSDVSGDHRNYLVEANTSDGSIVQRIGPTLGIATRPFTIDSQERWAFIITLGLNGFQVGSISTGAILFTVPAQGVSNASCTAFVTCSHGISLSPDGKEIYTVDYYNNYVHVFDVSGLPSSAPQWVAKIPLAHSYAESGAWVTHSRDGRFVFVGQSGDVIDTNTRQIVGYLPALSTTKIYTEVDFQGSQVSFTPLNRSGVGYAH
jgi:hypothetical protein